MDTSTYFNMMAKVMGEAAPPASEDGPMLDRMAKIGLFPGQAFDMSKLDTSVQAAVKDTNKSAMKIIEANKDSMGAIVNGWVITKGLGHYGANYTKRAVVAAYGPGGFLGELNLLTGQTVYLTARVTEAGRIHRISQLLGRAEGPRFVRSDLLRRPAQGRDTRGMNPQLGAA